MAWLRLLRKKKRRSSSRGGISITANRSSAPDIELLVSESTVNYLYGADEPDAGTLIANELFNN